MNPHDELRALTDLFSGDDPVFAGVEHIPQSATSAPYKTLLAHHHHMTVSMERYHDSPVDVRVLEWRRDDDVYSRKILLVKSGTDQVVQFGIMRFRFHYVTREVRDEILRGEIPLGRVLIDYNVLRHVEPAAILKLTAGPKLASSLQMPVAGRTYGCLATIFCNDRPTVDLLEVSALQSDRPLPSDRSCACVAGTSFGIGGLSTT